MLRFGKQARDSASASNDDLLGLSDEAEFEASVRAAWERAAGRVAQPEPKKTPAADAEPEIVWTEQQDVYRPRPIEARAYLRSQSLESKVQVRAGQSTVLIRRDAYSKAVDHLRTDLKSELGGLLCGEALYDSKLDLYLVVVEVVLPALHGEGTAISFSYTPEAWAAMLPGWLEMNPDWTVVGSYHSHPGLGVFLSSVDRTTQVEVFPHVGRHFMVMPHPFQLRRVKRVKLKSKLHEQLEGVAFLLVSED